MAFQHRFLSVLAPFWEAKMAPKSIKNRSKLGFRAFLFRHRFLYWFLIEFWSQLRPFGSPKSLFFLRKNNDFQNIRLSKLTSILDPILMPTCVHVGLQNRRFFKILGFQDGLKFSSISGSIFYRFWVRLGLQLGAILGAKTPRNPKNGCKKLRGELPKRGSEYDLSWSTVLASILEGPGWIFHRFWRVKGGFLEGQGSIFKDFEWFFLSFVAYFEYVFGWILPVGVLRRAATTWVIFVFRPTPARP